ncbi:multidrug ABC transporter permease [Corynebacterium yudongzhengii]|uniref:Multidrug ABC transporter permease n=2 Tax=Corynebacterium yudongzhengii TaxID=2080740 RepID=A0A2U1T8P7_9CORY|nr:ABC transporter permease [Corynebacterium yudongzhengii]AWB82968.1 multidrug ABC transporter permease [Corynebacterium yudongzhengii]PWC02359.1 multidrug ABC transporter permease [Corynebacterium yudongzhengii]
MAIAQGRIEARLMLRHGEQLLLSLIIPAAMLCVAATMPVLGDSSGIDDIVPMILAIAATSSGFTGQAISLAFDRRYGALKRTGASGVPAHIIILGKILGVLAMVAVQVVVITLVALLLGFRPEPVGVTIAALTLVIGVATFTAAGLLMGGCLSAEIVLGLANLVWLVLVGVVGFVLYAYGLDDAGFFNLVPSVALATGLADSFAGSFPSLQLGVLVAWAVLFGLAARRWFRFDN